MLFCEGCQFIEMSAHSLAARLMRWAAGPPVSGVKHCLLMGLKNGNVLVTWPLVQLISWKEFAIGKVFKL